MVEIYALTGGPGSGKSSIILDLESRGEYVIREAAEDVIKLEQARGIEKPWEISGFQRKILKLQLQREERIPKEASRAYVDRGIWDGLAYLNDKDETAEEIKRLARYYSGIFLVENLGKTEKTKVRREDEVGTLMLEDRLKWVYLKAGFKLVTIPVLGSVTERTDLLLSVTGGENGYS